MGPIDLPSFVLGAVAALALVVLIRVLRRDMDPTRTSGNAILAPSRGFGGMSRSAPQAPPTTGPPSQQISELLRQGRKIEAIRLYREQTGASLAVAKDAVEALERRYPALGMDRSNRR